MSTTSTYLGAFSTIATFKPDLAHLCQLPKVFSYFVENEAYLVKFKFNWLGIFFLTFGIIDAPSPPGLLPSTITSYFFVSIDEK